MSQSLQYEEDYIQEIFPPLTKEKIERFFKEFREEADFKLESDKLEDLPESKKKVIYQTYVAKSLKTKDALKARFYQSLECFDDFKNIEILEEKIEIKGDIVDLLLDDKDSGNTVCCFIIELLDRNELNRVKKIVSDYIELAENGGDLYDIDEIYLICGRIDRKIGNDIEFINLNGKKLSINCYLEYFDFNRPFNDEDLIIIEDMKIYGFNFGSIEDILSMIKKTKGKGRYMVYVETKHGVRNLLWQGLIYPREILHS
jgi:hypothetical protein